MNAAATRFSAVMVDGPGTPARLQELDASRLPDDEVLVAVSHSGLNYKDALAVTGTGAVVRSFPMITGIDLAGRVLSSRSPQLAAGDLVFATGHGLG